jgi:hypothetical protein
MSVLVVSVYLFIFYWRLLVGWDEKGAGWTCAVFWGFLYFMASGPALHCIAKAFCMGKGYDPAIPSD